MRKRSRVLFFSLGVAISMLRTINTQLLGLGKHERYLRISSGAAADQPEKPAAALDVRSLKVLMEDHRDQYSRTDDEHSLLLHKPPLRVTPKNMRETITYLLRQWHALAARHGVRYWLQGATLLGQLCNDGILPGDDDAGHRPHRRGVGAGEGHAGRRPARWQKMRTGRSHVQVDRAGRASTVTSSPPSSFDLRNDVYIDLSLFHRSPDTGLLTHTKAWSIAGTPQTIRMADSDLFPLRSCEFEDFTLCCPQRPMRMLKQLYKTPFTNCAHQPLDDA